MKKFFVFLTCKNFDSLLSKLLFKNKLKSCDICNLKKAVNCYVINKQEMKWEKDMALSSFDFDEETSRTSWEICKRENDEF